MHFIDRSNTNGPASADDLKRAPITHLYAKASEGLTFKDATWKERRASAHTAGTVFGSYHFARSGDPTAEADFFLSIIGTPKAGHLRPCLDLETGQTAGWAEAFVKHLHSKLGYWPVVYGNTSTIPTLRAASVAVRTCPWWRAEYGPNDGKRHILSGGDQGASAHQYTSVATIPGISGHTDASVFLSAAAVAAMVVPDPRKPIVAKKPDHYVLHYVDAFGDPQKVETKFPGIWRRRHRRAGWRGDLLQKPVHHK